MEINFFWIIFISKVQDRNTNLNIIIAQFRYFIGTKFNDYMQKEELNFVCIELKIIGMNISINIIAKDKTRN